MESLFFEELDGPTFASQEEFLTWEEAQRDAGPKWSNYGGWVN